MREFRGLKDIANIKSGGKKAAIAAIKNEHGVKQSDPESIAEVFAAFYEDLYRSRFDVGLQERVGGNYDTNQLQPFTKEDFQASLRKMNSKKNADANGVVAELLRAGCQELWDATLELFNDILSCKQAPPEAWKRTKLIVLFKKGDATSAEN